MKATKMSRIESAIRVVLAFNKAFNRHDVPGMTQLLSNDCIFETSASAPDGTVYTGKDDIAHYLHDFLRESPQAHIQIEDIFGFGHRCIMRWRYKWVDTSGNKQYVRGVDIFLEKNGVICEKLSYEKGTHGY